MPYKMPSFCCPGRFLVTVLLIFLCTPDARSGPLRAAVRVHFSFLASLKRSTQISRGFPTAHRLCPHQVDREIKECYEEKNSLKLSLFNVNHSYDGPVPGDVFCI